MNTGEQERYIQLFLRHRRGWAVAVLLFWLGTNMVILATSKWMESHRAGQSLPLWEPLCWEISSNLVILLLIPVALYLNDRWLMRFSLRMRVVLHAMATVPFSLVHVGAMVAIRHLCYRVMGGHYYFGDLSTELFYEYRKDAQAYLLLVVVISAWRFIVRRLQGEASYLADSEEQEPPLAAGEPEPLPERLLIKKLGREFLIQVSDIDWIEAAGNYANLHVKNSVYPMRITMEKLEKQLPAHFTRIHRSTIVNLQRVAEIQPLDTGDYQVTLGNEAILTLSRRYRERFKNIMSLT